ncbi:dipeptide transport ATP-binding protein DppF [Halorhodospira halochloris]|uniref:Dipeptide transport ATP-binding protein DppF n=1 Tax=Halorhodospira halochloris TaxID=1052 RepID=A0A0X8X732_HALHR|nr:ABC transporter ATP-binding protein [Halorhodospira halochloris]MBK1650726.1 oligopeptide ABC transporter ATP-binding protein [Halorhodospira halochloris]BAU56781.1 dipeptide transport ATP-binding protein DppF [Halorhodospira halochloris]
MSNTGSNLAVTKTGADSAALKEPLLVVDRLQTHFELRQWGFLRIGSVQAVDNVSFSLDSGEAATIVGESGCGKSSLARTLLGLHRPTGGDVRFAGSSLTNLQGKTLKAYRAKVGYVQQDPYGALPPYMDIRRILEEPLIIHGISGKEERQRRIKEALKEVGLEPPHEVWRKFPHQLSGGQQQRVVIARALILRPQMIIADEPVSMLDASVRVEILELLRHVQLAHGIALLYITHDLSTVRHYAHRAMVMYAGRIIEQAPVDSLLERPLHPYTGALLAALSDPDPANARRQRRVPKGEPPSLVSPPEGCRFHPRCSQVMIGRCEYFAPKEFQPRIGHRVACWLRG